MHPNGDFQDGRKPLSFVVQHHLKLHLPQSQKSQESRSKSQFRQLPNPENPINPVNPASDASQDSCLFILIHLNNRCE